MELEINDLYAGYGRVTILWDISLKVPAGKIIALVGSNGGGKTTLLKTVLGLLAPTQGRIRFNGSDVTGLKPLEMVKRGISMIPEGFKLFSGMTVHENLYLGAYHVKKKREILDKLEEVFDIFPELKDRRRQLVGTMSGGQQQMCSIGRALMSNPKLLLIDELSLGLAPKLVEFLVEKIKAIHQKTNMSILLVEQDVDTAFSLAEYGYVIESGHVTLSGHASELLENPTIISSYLGL